MLSPALLAPLRLQDPLGTFLFPLHDPLFNAGLPKCDNSHLLLLANVDIGNLFLRTSQSASSLSLVGTKPDLILLAHKVPRDLNPHHPYFLLRHPHFRYQILHLIAQQAPVICHRDIRSAPVRIQKNKGLSPPFPQDCQSPPALLYSGLRFPEIASDALTLIRYPSYARCLIVEY